MQVLSPSSGKEAASSSRLLIVDGDAYFRATLRQQLAVEGFNDVFEVGVVADLDNALSRANPDLILLDIKMSDGNGIDICQRLRRNGFAKPIIMLTAKGAEGDIVLGLEAGANDYITKPLRLGELIALIHNQLRQFRALDDARLEIGNLSFVPANKMLHEIGSDRMQALTEKEATILKFLYWAFPNDVTKDELLAEVWGFQNGVSTHTLETHIYRLRQKISRLTKKQLVLTIEKGYRLAD
ncbi:MAG: response regulator transcription factor [Candidatus Puniceispirillaceae bacterium]